VSNIGENCFLGDVLKVVNNEDITFSNLERCLNSLKPPCQVDRVFIISNLCFFLAFFA